MSKKILIIGGGLAGLAAGCYGQMSGFETHIFEHHSKPGGVCTSWKRQDYMIDGCIRFLMGYKEGDDFYEIYNDLGAITANNFGGITDFMNFIDEKTHTSFIFNSSRTQMRERLGNISNRDRRRVNDFINGAITLAGLRPPAKPLKLQTRLDRLKMLFIMRNELLTMQRYMMPMKEYTSHIKSPWLKKILSNLFFDELPAFMTMMVTGTLFNGQLATVTGGSRKFAYTIADRYTKGLGGTLSVKSAVEKIIVEDGKARGVRLKDGTIHEGDIVISACDLHSTLYEMLDDRFTTPAQKEMFRNWKTFTPIILFSYGLKGAITSNCPRNLIFLNEPVEIADRMIDRLFIVDFSYDATLSPQGSTILQVTIDSSYDYWSSLRDDMDRYKAEKEKASDKILGILERHYPGISSMVEMTDVATPFTFYRYTKNYRGAYEGWIGGGRDVVEKSIPGIDNLYLAGQWVEPGGGVPIAIVSGRNAIQLICSKEGAVFRGGMK